MNACHPPQSTARREKCARQARRNPAAVFLLILVAGLSSPSARAERADRDKPTNVEAGRMVADDARRISTFEGNVVVTKGTLSLRAERVVVRQDAQGNYHASATGSPVRFRQRMDPKGDRPALWMDGEAMRIELDDREQKVELFDKARVTRDQDEVRGDYIFLDQRAETFTVSTGKGGSDGRVRAVIQPKLAPAETK